MVVKRVMRIGPDVIGDDTDCYVIAEIGHNHQGNLEQAKQLFRAAKENGANAVKLQKRNNRELYTKAFYDKPYENENSYGRTYGEHREALEFGRAEYEALKAYAQELGITFFSTAFDFSSADFLEALDMPAYKIASGDLTNLPLIRHVAAFGKPMIISTGGARFEDVRRAYDAILEIQPQLCILQCTSGYPCKFEEMNLRVIEKYRESFPRAVIGLSAHDNGISMAVLAYGLGARVVEKHFTLDRAMKGTDHAFSLERPGMHKLVRDLKRARLALGDGRKYRYPSEEGPLLKMGKSLYAARDLPAGHLLARSDIAIKSPGDGIPPYELDNILGAVLAAPVSADERFSHEKLRLTKPTPARTPAVDARPLEERVRGVRLAVFDFDGVFTDNRVYVGEDGKESVSCSRADGFGLARLKELGVETLVLSTETNRVVAARSAKLGVRCIHGCADKLAALVQHTRELGVAMSEVAYVGNDINDLACLRAVGVPIAVSDAVPAVLSAVAHRTHAAGGQGAVREVCDWMADLIAAIKEPSVIPYRSAAA